MPDGHTQRTLHAPPWHLDRMPHESPPRWNILVPGWVQFNWNQWERGLVLMVSFLSGIIAWLWTWGSWLSFGFVAFVFVTHITSIIDVLRQFSFPTYCRRRTLLVTSATLGIVIYLPIVCLVLVTAWPGVSVATGTGYLVNCWAYHHDSPRPGDWIWLRMPPHGVPHGAEVVAVSGQEVEWTGRKWLVDGRDCPWHTSLRLAAWPQTCRFQVPKDQVLVEPEADGNSDVVAGPLVLVSAERIIGRAWARYYPVWDRQLL